MDKFRAGFLRGFDDIGRAFGIEPPAKIRVVFGPVHRGIGGAVYDNGNSAGLLRCECFQGGGVGNVNLAVGTDTGKTSRQETPGKLGAEHAPVANEPDFLPGGRGFGIRPLFPGHYQNSALPNRGSFRSLSESRYSIPRSGQRMPTNGSFQTMPPSSSG
jgi:hypothetical protein